jgi:hypothetical protein
MNIYSGVRSSPSRVGVVQLFSRMLKMSADCVLAALRGSTYGTEYDSPLRLLRPCRTAFLNILLGIGGFGERLGDSFQW